METLSETDFRVPFSADTRRKGEELLSEGKIRLKERRDGEPFEARVPFFRRYHDVALLRRPDGTLEHDCTCPHTANTSEGCEHLWGLVLAINAVTAELAKPRVVERSLAPLYVVSCGVGSLRVDLAEREADGSVTALKAEGPVVSRIDGVDDKALIQRLAPSAGGRRTRFEGGGFVKESGPWKVPDGDALGLLTDLARTGRAVLVGSSERPLERDVGEILDFVLRFEHDPQREQRVRARGWLVGTATAPVRLEQAAAVVPTTNAVVILRNVVHPVRSHGAPDWIALCRAEKPILVPTGELDDFLRRLASTAPLPRLWRPDQTEPPPLGDVNPTPRVTVTRRPEGLRAFVTFEYGGREAAEGGPDVLVFDQASGRQGRRNRPKEAALVKQFEQGPVRRDPDVAGAFLITPSRLEAFSAELVERGFDVLVEDRRLLRAGRPSLRLSEGGDVFSLLGTLDYDGEAVPIDRILGAHREGKRFLELRGGRGLIPAEWSAALDRLARLGDGETPLSFAGSQSLLVSSWLDAQQDRTSHRLNAALRELTQPPITPPPKGLEATLRPYQAEGVSWLTAVARHRLGACLADDMGLGKTVQVLATLLAQQQLDPASNALIVVPRSLVGNWAAELARFTPALRVLIYDGEARHDAEGELAAPGVVLATYGIVRRDAERLAATRFTTIVLDEAHTIKNPESLIHRATKRLVGDVRIAVTGTPVENRLRDFWALMEFLNPGLLGPERRFAAAFADGSSAGRDLLQRLMNPLVRRRTKEQVAPELPPRIEQTLRCPLADDQATLYRRLAAELGRSLERRADADGVLGERPMVLEGLLRLRQAACHPDLIPGRERGSASGKMDVLLDALDQILASGNKSVLFSQFTSFLDLVARELTTRRIPFEMLTGTTKDRTTPVQRFQEDPTCPVLLASLKAGGVGLNLTAADYVFLLDPWWNPAAEAQAVDRAHRIGRERAVVAYRLVSEGTIEERIEDLKDRKRALARGLLEGAGEGLAELTAEDLTWLLGEADGRPG